MATLNKKIAAIPAVLALLFSTNVFASEYIGDCTIVEIEQDPQAKDLSGRCRFVDNGDGTSTLVEASYTNNNNNRNTVTGGDVTVDVGGNTLTMGDQISSTVISDLFGDVNSESHSDSRSDSKSDAYSNSGSDSRSSSNSRGGNSGGNTFGTSYKNRSISVGSLNRTFNRATVQCQTAWSFDLGYFLGLSNEDYDQECLDHFSNEAEKDRKHEKTMADFNEYLYQKHAPERTREEFMAHVKDFIIPTTGKDAVNYQALTPEAKALYGTLMTTTKTLLANDKEVLAAQDREAKYAAMADVRKNRNAFDVRVAQAKIDADIRAFEEAERRAKIASQLKSNIAIVNGNEACAKAVSQKLASVAGKADEVSAKLRQEAILEAKSQCKAEIVDLSMYNPQKHCKTDDSYEEFGGSKIMFAAQCKNARHGIDENGKKVIFGERATADAYASN